MNIIVDFDVYLRNKDYFSRQYKCVNNIHDIISIKPINGKYYIDPSKIPTYVVLPDTSYKIRTNHRVKLLPDYSKPISKWVEKTVKFNNIIECNRTLRE